MDKPDWLTFRKTRHCQSRLVSSISLLYVPSVMPIKCTMFSMQFWRCLVLGELFRRVHCVSIYWYLFCCILDSSLCLNVDGERVKQLILMHFDGQHVVISTRFPMCDVQLYARCALPVCSFKARCFVLPFWRYVLVKLLLFRRLFDSFQSNIFCVRNKLAFLSLSLCVPQSNVDIQHTHIQFTIYGV